MSIQLPDARQLSDEALQVLRLRALRGIELGYSELELADLLGVCHETISRWWTAYLADGLAALPPSPTGRPLAPRPFPAAPPAGRRPLPARPAGRADQGAHRLLLAGGGRHPARPVDAPRRPRPDPPG